MKLYKVINYPMNGGGVESDGFGTREAAERFASGLAASGKVDGSVTICAYDDGGREERVTEARSKE